MNREERRAASDASVPCSECGESVKPKNLADHFARAHPGVALPDMTDAVETAVAQREQSRADVGSLDRGAVPEAAQSPEQEPIPNPADRRPSTQDKAIGY